MNTFVVKKWFDEGERCSFYTVLIGENKYSETDRFFMKFEEPTISITEKRMNFYVSLPIALVTFMVPLMLFSTVLRIKLRLFHQNQRKEFLKYSKWGLISHLDYIVFEYLNQL